MPLDQSPQLKWIDRNDNLLGTITIPMAAYQMLMQRGGRGSWEFAYSDGAFLRDHSLDWSADAKPPFEYHKVAVYQVNSHFGYGVVTVFGLHPEQFEKVPDCTFSPSIAYIRTLMDAASKEGST